MEFSVDHSIMFRNYGLVIAAAIALPLAIWRSFIAQKQTRIAAENHLAETYTKAIDQIGETQEGIQLGGLYALEKIANSNKQYFGQIMEVLCSFVRLHAPISDPILEQKDYPTIAVQAALTIIGRRNTDFDIPSAGQNKVTLDLSETHLERLVLVNANLQGANLAEANLGEANLVGTNL